jgi:hypothetical protein
LDPATTLLQQQYSTLFADKDTKKSMGKNGRGKAIHD